MRPISGRNPFAGSSVVMRHCSAAPRIVMRPAPGPMSGSVSPAAIAQLRLHQVDVGNLLGDGVLDLDAWVHLDEHVVAGRVDEELDRPRASSSRSPRERHGIRADPLPQLPDRDSGPARARSTF